MVQMIDYQQILGAIAVVLGLIGYVPYFRDIFKGKTKPHAFSWLVWATLTGIAFAVQISENAGPGSWITGVTAVMVFIIFLIALKKGQRSFPLFDWISLIVAIGAIALWLMTKDPTFSIILVTLIDLVGFLPTFRKGYVRPFEETPSMFILGSLKFVPALFALETLTIATWLYPLSLVVMNGTFALMLLVRRKQLQAP